MSTIRPDRRAEIAAAAGLNEQYLYQCMTGRRRLPLERCPGVELASGAELTCDQLRDDVAWIRVPDPAWPHPAGRPCIDVAAPQQAAEA